MKCTVCILKPSITVKQRMCIRIGSHSRIKGVVYQRVVVAVSNHVGDYSSVVQIKNDAEINLMYFSSLVPFELRYIRQPLLVWFVGMKRSVEDILCYILRISCVPCTTFVCVFYGRLDVFDAADSQHPLITDANIMIPFQLIPDPTVALIRTFSVDFLSNLSNSVVFLLSAGLFTRKPAIIGVSGYVQNVTTRFDGISIFLVAIPNGDVFPNLSYFRKASLLSNSSSFFSRSRSIFVMYSSCFNRAISI